MNALRNIKVIELAGLAPAPFCGKILKDFGATVIRIERIESAPEIDVFKDGKLTMYVDLKKSRGQAFVRNMCKHADVLIDPFRSGVLEKINLNPIELVELNKRLIVARLTGYGQLENNSNDEDSLAKRSGHDINYIALSGLLSQFTTAKSGNKPVFPINILGDFAGGGLMCAFGILISLIEREHTGRGQIIDSNITESTSYIGSWLFKTRKPESEMQYLVWPNLNEKHSNLLDSGQPFYDCYECKDGKFMALGALEPKFFEEFISNLSRATMDDEIRQQIKIHKIEQFDENLREQLETIFKLKTRDEWTKVFISTDSCCTPVLEPEEVHSFDHFKQRKSFIDQFTPNVSPRFWKSDQTDHLNNNLIDVLKSLDIDNQQLEPLLKEGVVMLKDKCKL